MQENRVTISNSRFQKIQNLVLDLLEIKRDIERDQPYTWSLTHAISCSQICKLLATSRGLDVEIAAIAGVVHDLAIIATGKFEKHGPIGAPLVEEFLTSYNLDYGEECGLIAPEEISMIVQATKNHTSKKDFTDNLFDELIKDADSLDRFLHGKETYDFYYKRSQNALHDIGLKIENII
jgi:uncharacterized protein